MTEICSQIEAKMLKDCGPFWHKEMFSDSICRPESGLEKLSESVFYGNIYINGWRQRPWFHFLDSEEMESVINHFSSQKAWGCGYILPALCPLYNPYQRTGRGNRGATDTEFLEAAKELHEGFNVRGGILEASQSVKNHRDYWAWYPIFDLRTTDKQALERVSFCLFDGKL